MPRTRRRSAAEREAALRTIRRCLTETSRLSKNTTLQESLAAAVGYSLGGPYYGTLALIGQNSGCTVSDLVDASNTEQSTVSRRVRVLEERGLVTRDVNAEDRRSYHLRLTEDGESVFRALDRGWNELLGDLCADWTRDELECFANLFERFAGTFERYASEAVGG